MRSFIGIFSENCLTRSYMTTQSRCVIHNTDLLYRYIQGYNITLFKELMMPM